LAHLSFCFRHQPPSAPPLHCGKATCTQSSSRIWLPSVFVAGAGRVVWVRAADPCAFEMVVVVADGAACGRGSDCAMTGDAKTATLIAVRITFMLVLICRPHIVFCHSGPSSFGLDPIALCSGLSVTMMVCRVWSRARLRRCSHQSSRGPLRVLRKKGGSSSPFLS
jgi:hypothetical protein